MDGFPTLRMTHRAHALARALVREEGGRGLRICDAFHGLSSEPELLVGPSAGPGEHDLVLQVGDLEVYLDDGAARALELRVVDVVPDGRGGVRWQAGAEAALVAEAMPLRASAPPLARRDVPRLLAGWERDLDLLVRFDAYCREREAARRDG